MTFKRTTLFLTDAATLEKILRLFQSLSQILLALSTLPKDIKTYSLLRRQFALGRRYFRFFKFLGCFQKAHEAFYAPGSQGLDVVLGVGKWGFLGMYMGMESLTILDAMGVYPVPWTQRCMLEANRFWFYSLVFSIISGVLQLWYFSAITPQNSEKRTLRSSSSSAEKPTLGASPKSTTKEQDKEHLAKLKQSRSRKRGIMRRLTADICDLFIPGSVTGWIPSSMIVLGCASAVSTVLSFRDIWDRISVN